MNKLQECWDMVTGGVLRCLYTSMYISSGCSLSASSSILFVRSRSVPDALIVRSSRSFHPSFLRISYVFACSFSHFGSCIALRSPQLTLSWFLGAWKFSVGGIDSPLPIPHKLLTIRYCTADPNENGTSNIDTGINVFWALQKWESIFPNFVTSRNGPKSWRLLVEILKNLWRVVATIERRILHIGLPRWETLSRCDWQRTFLGLPSKKGCCSRCSFSSQKVARMGYTLLKTLVLPPFSADYQLASNDSPTT